MDGKALAERIRAEIAQEVRGAGEIGLATVARRRRSGVRHLIRLKHKAAAEVGINAKDIRLASQTTEDELLAAGRGAERRRRRSTALLVQLPLPDHIDEARDPRDRPGQGRRRAAPTATSASLVLGSPTHVGATPVGRDAPARGVRRRRSTARARSSSAAATSSASPRRCFCCTRTRPSPSAILADTRPADRSRAKPTCSSSPSGRPAVIGPDDVSRAARR